MDLWAAMLVGVGSALVLYSLLVAALILLGRREAARAVAGFVPDCVVLCRRLIGDPEVPRRHKLLLAVVVPYLALPFDLVPDFIPVAGYLDDAVIVAFVLRRVLRGSGADVIQKHWPGPAASLRVVQGLAGFEHERPTAESITP